MAIELQVSVAVVNTDPVPPDHPEVLMRASRASTLTFDMESGTAGEFSVARHRLGALFEDIRIDIDNQLELGERNMQRQEEA